MWIKVCGIRDCETARQLSNLEINAIGLNFFNRSPRVVSVDVAVEISRILPAHIDRVGVFVNHTVREVEAIANQCRLSVLQLHGDEPPSYFADLKRRLPKIKLVRAWRMEKDRLDGLKTFLNECKNWNCALAGCLVDAHTAGVYGGSGKKVPWNRLANDYLTEEWPPLILAGGLKPANVCSAIQAVKPWGIDVASGVESIPGVKNIDLVKEFVANARSVLMPPNSANLELQREDD